MTIDIDASMTKQNNFIRSVKSVCDNMAVALEAKNKAYGDSVNNSTKIVRLLYPNGIRPEQLDDFLIVIRVLDKLSRIARGDKKAFGENPWNDVQGYATLQVAKQMLQEIKDEHDGCLTEDIESEISKKFLDVFGVSMPIKKNIDKCASEA